MDVKEGQKAPLFILPTAGGHTVSLDEYLGKQVVILYFYPTDLTPSGVAEVCFIRDCLAEITAAGAVVIGVSPDSVHSHEQFAAEQSINFPLLADEQHEVCRQYGVWTDKFRDDMHYMGVDRSTFVIDREGDIVRIWHNVDVSDHYDDILRTVRMLAG